MPTPNFIIRSRLQGKRRRCILYAHVRRLFEDLTRVVTIVVDPSTWLVVVCPAIIFFINSLYHYYYYYYYTYWQVTFFTFSLTRAKKKRQNFYRKSASCARAARPNDLIYDSKSLHYYYLLYALRWRVNTISAVMTHYNWLYTRHNNAYTYIFFM